jgi:hypothetical protein
MFKVYVYDERVNQRMPVSDLASIRMVVKWVGNCGPAAETNKEEVPGALQATHGVCDV